MGFGGISTSSNLSSEDDATVGIFGDRSSRKRRTPGDLETDRPSKRMAGLAGEAATGFGSSGRGLLHELGSRIMGIQSDLEDNGPNKTIGGLIKEASKGKTSADRGHVLPGRVVAAPGRSLLSLMDELVRMQRELLKEQRQTNELFRLLMQKSSFAQTASPIDMNMED